MTAGLAEDSGAVNWPIWSSRICSSARNIGPSSIVSARGGHIRTVPVPDASRLVK